MTFLLTFFQIVIAPPLFRTQPRWYSSNLTQVALRFSASFSATKPPNLHLLPSFACQDLMPDGIHLTPVAGLHYVLYLFDQTFSILESLALHPEAQQVHLQEVVRRHDDRLAYLENGHTSLSKRVDLKAAIDAEFDDWVINRSEEDRLTVLGLKRLSSDLGEKEWQDAARRQVNDLIRLVLKTNKINLEYEVLYVTNPIRN